MEQEPREARDGYLVVVVYSLQRRFSSFGLGVRASRIGWACSRIIRYCLHPIHSFFCDMDAGYGLSDLSFSPDEANWEDYGQVWVSSSFCALVDRLAWWRDVVDG